MAKGNKYIIGRYIISLILFLAGTVAAVYLVHKLRPAKPAAENVEAKTSKDTMYVRLLNRAFADHATADSGSTGSRNKGPATSPPIVAKTPSTKQTGQPDLPPQSGRWLLPNNPATIDIKAISDDTAKTLSQKYAAKGLTSVPVAFGIIAGLVIMALAFFSKSESIENATVKDIDPEDLQELFSQFKEQMVQLRNPRKILRFKNMVKYHYYFLKKEHLNTPENLQKMMWILIGIQNDPSIIDIEKISSGSLSDSKWFLERIASRSWSKTAGISQSDNELMMTILKLNVDMGT